MHTHIYISMIWSSIGRHPAVARFPCYCDKSSSEHGCASVSVVDSLAHTPRSGLTGEYPRSSFSLLRSLHVDIHRGCIGVYSHPQSIPLCPHPHQQLTFRVTYGAPPGLSLMVLSRRELVCGERGVLCRWQHIGVIVRAEKNDIRLTSNQAFSLVCDRFPVQ